MIPPNDQVGLLKLFDAMRLLDTGSLLGRVIPERILGFMHDDPRDSTIRGVEARNRALRENNRDIYKDPNVGERPDWYSDAVFAQQAFTGTNPIYIQLASKKWVEDFKTAATAQRNTHIIKFIESAGEETFYIQDNSYYREAVGLAPDDLIISKDKDRWGNAGVVLYHLSERGKLHPLAILIDFKETILKSVTIFNERLTANAPTEGEETDWPWRYAKTSFQACDWSRHELATHLVNTHLIEEVIIVASYRVFPTSHPVYKLLSPHWAKTLSLNATARSTLVPTFIGKVIGFTDDQMYCFIRHAYKQFNWTQMYIPNDLTLRGFPPAKLGSQKYHNYVYAKNINSMWRVLHKFVVAVIAISYESDEAVASDKYITEWTTEMRSPTGAQMPSFPIIQSIADLADAITMCIHIASPQHNAINYLQEYYQSFVISRPPALWAPPPATLRELLTYREQDLVAALPLKRPREFLMASHFPRLLSKAVAEDQNLINWALSVWKLAETNRENKLAEAAKVLWTDLGLLEETFKGHSGAMDDQTKPYEILNPGLTSVSIVI